MPNGVVTGVIELRNAAGKAVTTEPFTVKATDEFEITAAPTSVQAMQNTSATYMISMSSSKDNFKQLAKLDVTGLPGKARGKFTPPQIAPGESSTLVVDLNNSNVAPGNYSFKVTGTVNVQGNEMVREVTLSLTVMAGGTTSLRGRVLSIDDEPVPGATVSMDGKSAVTDAAGVFILSGITPGTKRALKVDGKTASTPGRTYPTVVEPAKVLANQSNSSPYVFYLPIVDTQHEININPNQETFITTPRVPGLKMTIPAAAKPTNRDGSPATRVSITPVPPDRLPSPLPAGVKVPMIYTNQPGGAISKEPMPVTFPNLGGDDPGTKLPVYAFNHDEVEWQIIGYGVVSRDGKTIEPDVNSETGKPYGLMDFSWFGVGTGTVDPASNDDTCSLPPPKHPNNAGQNNSNNHTGDPVDLTTGVKKEYGTDISFGGARGGITLTRIYSGDLDARAYQGAFGRGTNINYGIKLTGTFLSGGSGRVVMSDEYHGRLFSYSHTETDGTLIFKSTGTISQLGDIVRRLPNNNLEYRYADGTKMTFDSNGKLTSVVDRNSNTTTLTYSGSNLTSITDPVGRSITFTYTNNRITRATDPINRQWDYTYDGAGRLSTVTDPLNKTITYNYINNGLSKVTDKRGNVVKEVIYGGTTGNVIEQRFADGGFEKYSNENLTTTITRSSGRTRIKRFNAAGYAIEETDELGQHSRMRRDITTNLVLEVIGHCGCSESVKTYDSRGNLLTVTDELGQTMSYEYEATFNNVTKITDKLNKVTTFTYDSNGDLLTTTNALNQTTSYAYDQYGQMTSMTDAINHTWTYDYDSDGNLISKTDPLNNETTMEYDGIGRMTAKEDPLQRRTEMTYDAMSRVLIVTEPSTAVTTYTYDANGNKIDIENDLNNHWKMAYDSKNRLIAKTDPLNRIIRMEYNTDDELVKSISPSNRTTLYTYTARGQLATMSDPVGGITHYTYDKDKNLVTLSDQRGKIITFTYDELDRNKTVIDPSGQTTSVTYNAQNKITTVIDRMGRDTTVTYDNLHRPTSIEYDDATVTVTYDAVGKRTQVTDTQGGTISWAYDNANRLLTETTSLGTVTYTYNNASQRATMTADDQTQVAYNYDTAGRLSTITQGTETFTYGYDILSRRTSLQRPNGVTSTYTYNSMNRLTQLKHQKGTDPKVEEFIYTYNLDDEIASISSLYSTPNLSSAQTVGTANNSNRISSFGNANYTYNNIGEITSKTVTGVGTTNYTWDARGRLTQATLPNSQTVSYSYDTFGRRKSRTAGGVTTNYLYDFMDVVRDTSSDSSRIDYLNGLSIDEQLSQTIAGLGTLYFIKDHINSTVALTVANGSVSEQLDYQPFGEFAGSSSTRFN